MIKIETKKVKGQNGEKGFLILKASALTPDRLPLKYLDLKKEGDIALAADPNGAGLVIWRFKDGRIGRLEVKVGQAIEADNFLEVWEDIKAAGNRLTEINRWEGEQTFKY